MEQTTNQQNQTQIQQNQQEVFNKKEEVASNKEAYLEFLTWATLYNVQKHRSVSFVSLYKTLGITSTNTLWFGPKICWLAGQSQEFNKMINKKSRSNYDLTEFGKKLVEKLSKKYGEFTIESAKRLYEISQKVTIKDLREFAKSIEEA